MGEIRGRRLEAALARHYAAQREGAKPGAIDSLVGAMVAEDARARREDAPDMGGVAFVMAQVRYIPTWVWIAQCAFVALMVTVAHVSGDSSATRWAVGLLSAASVLTCVPTLHASTLHGVIELERACRNDAARVLVARLVILGCSGALCVALMVAGTSAATGLSGLRVALWACPPYFCSCAGSLLILRRVRPSAALAASAAWTATCCSALYAVGQVFPRGYDDASLAVWALAALVALAWLAREATLTVRAAAEGLDPFSPHAFMTYR